MDQTVSPRPPRTLRLVLVLAVATFTGCINSPTQPTPQDYVLHALDVMNAGLYANTTAWTQERATATREAVDAQTTSATYAILEQAAKVAGGKHSSFTPPDEVARDAAASANEQDLDLPAVTVDGTVATVVVPAFGSDDPTSLARYADTGAQAIVAALPAAACGWVIDVQDNLGGGDWPMLAALSPLISDGVVVRFRDRDGQDDAADRLSVQGTAVSSGGDVKLTAHTPAFTKQLIPVAVIEGPGTASAGEAVVAAFHGQSEATILGQPSAGFSTGNTITDLSDGAEIVLTTAVVGDRKGTWFGGPIPPDDPTVISGGSIPDARRAAATWLKSECSNPAVPR